MPMTKTRKILDLVGELADGTVVFASTGDPEDEGPRPTLTILWHDFDDMGQPETITVSVEPGDLLNVE